jgi:hypothetical protein
LHFSFRTTSTVTAKSHSESLSSVFNIEKGVASMKLKGFSFSKLTELQVQGARERASRRIEVSQLASRLEHAETKWRTRIQRNNVQDWPIYSEAIIEAFSQDDRDISPFMVARLAELCRQEYREIEAQKGLRRLHNDYRVNINWMYQAIESAGKEKDKVEKELKSRIEALKQELEVTEKKRIEELRAILEWKRRELMRLRERKLHELENMEKKKHFTPKAPEPVIVEKWNDRSDSWVDIEDDDFQSNGGSEWVLCS